MELSLQIDEALILFLSSGILLFTLATGVLLLARKTGQQITNRLYGALLLLATLTALNLLLANAGIYSQFQFLYFIPIIYDFWFGPLLFFYTLYLVDPARRRKPTDFLHFMLPMAQAVFYWSIGFRSMAFKSHLWQTVIGPWLQTTESVLSFVLFATYAWAAYRILQRNQRQAQPRWRFWKLRWMQRFFLVVFAFLAVEVLYLLMQEIAWRGWEVNLYNVPWFSFPLRLANALTLGWMAWHGLNHLQPGSGYVPLPSAEASDRTPKTPEENPEVVEQVQHYMREEKPYLDPELTLTSLARQVGLHEKQLSALLNGQLQTSFPDFVNGYRIETVKEHIRQGSLRDRNLLGLALDAGFNSKATFNRVFRNREGMTPSEYHRLNLS